MPNKELAVWCLGYFIGFVWVIILRDMNLPLFLELNLTIWIVCATLILSHDAVEELRRNKTIEFKDLI